MNQPRSRTRRLAARAAAAVLAVLALLPAVPGPVHADPQPAVRQVYVQGDSLTVGALPHLAHDFHARHLVLSPPPSAQVGRSVLVGLDILQRTRHLPGIVLIALGTNDLRARRADAAQWVRQARGIVGPDTVVYWVNVSLDGARYRNWPAVNAGLLDGVRADNAQRAQRQDRGRSYVLDWASYATDRQLPHAGDGVHYSADGYRLRSRFYAGCIGGAPALARYRLS